MRQTYEVRFRFGLAASVEAAPIMLRAFRIFPSSCIHKKKTQGSVAANVISILEILVLFDIPRPAAITAVLRRAQAGYTVGW